MPRLWGRDYSRTELLRRVGRLDQVAGVRLVELQDGLARGVRLLEFRTGTGFSFGGGGLGTLNLVWTLLRSTFWLVIDSSRLRASWLSVSWAVRAVS